MNTNADVSATQPRGVKRSVERSTIDFPYLDLENAFEIAEGVHAKGGTSCDWDGLAAHFQMAAQGGGFRVRLLSAKHFGLVVYERGRVSLTPLGLRSVDPDQQKSAKIEAFLNIGLYQAVFEKFRGNKLPPIHGLEGEMVTMGVAFKQKDKARLTFQRSAKYAGFFDSGADRLVRPELDNVTQLPKATEIIAHQQEAKRGVGDGTNQHPFIVGLLSKLPEPETPWSAKDRAKWLTTACNIFDMMYSDSDEGEITVTFTSKQRSAS